MITNLSDLVRRLILLFYLSLVGCSQSTDVVFAHDGELSGTAGIVLAERALSKVLGEKHGYLPVEYQSSPVGVGEHVAPSIEFAKDHPDKYFARNVNNFNRGHVLWGRSESDLIWEYSVIVELEETSVKCRVIKAK
jgi:hypothetical protein